MNTQTSRLADVITLAEAGRRLEQAGCGMRFERLRRFIIDHRLAIAWPGGGLRVKFSELEAKLLANRYERPAPTPKGRRNLFNLGGLDPAVKC